MSKLAQIQQRMAAVYAAKENEQMELTDTVVVADSHQGDPTPTKTLEQIMADNAAAAKAAKEAQYPGSTTGDAAGLPAVVRGAGTKPAQPTGPRNVSSALAAILEKAAAASAGTKGTAEETEPAKPRGGNRYVIYDETKIRAKLSPQGLFIMKALMNAGEVGLTKKQLTQMAIEAGQTQFPTNQPHDRAIGFYLSAFKNEGSLAFATGPQPVQTSETPGQPAATAETPDGLTDEDEEENEDEDEDEDEDEGDE